MAKYDITYSCGHDVTQDLWGKHKERERYIQWAERYGECAACRAANREKADAAFEAEHDLPPLTGTEKQIDWARDIRLEHMRKIVRYLAGIEARAEKAGKSEEHRLRSAAVLQVIVGQTSASWWIDRRDRPDSEIIQDAWRETAKPRSAS